jgi:hypothetical protein
MEHNREHAEVYREWAERVSESGNKELAEILERLHHDAGRLNLLFEEALKIV